MLITIYIRYHSDCLLMPFFLGKAKNQSLFFTCFLANKTKKVFVVLSSDNKHIESV